MEPGELEPICEICSLGAPKYTCPACSICTCSLPCVKQHKQERGCNGRHPPTTFLPLSQMTDDSITVDARLIEATQQAAESATRAEPKPDHKSAGRQGAFRWMLGERRLLVKCLPSSFTRHQQNKSRVIRNGSNRSVKWTVELRDDIAGTAELIHDVDEETVISSLTDKPVSVIDEGSKRPPSDRQRLLDPAKTLKDQLVDITIIEYPILSVISSMETLLSKFVKRMSGRNRMEPLIRHLQAMGMLRSQRVIDTMLSVDRGEFCQYEAYYDTPVPIGFNATISAPHMHAFAMETALPKLANGARVLDVGSGSGYLSVCFAKLVGPSGKVVGLEHIEGLVEASISNTRRSHEILLSSGRLEYVVGDGRLGHPPLAPYDLIHVGAASERVPKPLLDQLAPGGIMIIPVGEFFQAIRVVSKDAQGNVTERDELAVRYVPLTDRDAQLHYL